MDSSDNGIVVGDRGNIVDVTRLENQFKKDKCRAKSILTRSRNNLLLLVEEQDTPSCRAVKEACRKMYSCLELVVEVLTNVSDFYSKKRAMCERSQYMNSRDISGIYHIFRLSGLTKIQQKQGSYSIHRRSVDVCP